MNYPHNVHACSFVDTGSDGSLGSPRPALFSAVTRNTYSLFSSKPDALYLKSVMGDFVALTQRMPFFSLRSTINPVISLPPSCRGLFQEMATLFFVMLVGSGLLGGPGGPERNTQQLTF